MPAQRYCLHGFGPNGFPALGSSPGLLQITVVRELVNTEKGPEIEKEGGGGRFMVTIKSKRK